MARHLVGYAREIGDTWIAKIEERTVDILARHEAAGSDPRLVVAKRNDPSI
jgi:hypothetical protein